MTLIQLMLIILFLIIILQPLALIAYRALLNPTMTQLAQDPENSRPNIYRIEKNGAFKGLLMGSIHTSLGDKDVEQYINIVKQYESLNSIITETTMPHHTQMLGGLEKYLFEFFDNKTMKFIVLEPLATQQAFLSGIGILGPFMFGLPFPYAFVNTLTPLVCIYAQLRKGLLLFPEVLFNLCYPNAPEERLQQDRLLLSNFRKNFKNGYASRMREDLAQAVYLKSRDIFYAEKITQFLNDGHVTPVILIGSVHLSEQGALIECLKAKDWDLIAISLADGEKPMSDDRNGH